MRVVATGLATYPAVSVVCDRLEPDSDHLSGHTVTHPRVLVEVLSPSTADYDRGEKLAQCQQIASVEEIVLVSRDARSVDVLARSDGAWSRSALEGSGAVTLRSVACALPLDELYRDPLA